MKTLEELKLSLKLWKIFIDEICKIPHTSGNEAALAEHIKTTYREFGAEVLQDEAGNVLIRKKASPGKGAASTVLLQAHLDMVPQKAADKSHDFETDPISPQIDGEWVTADKTTLGADDGIGVAAMLALLASSESFGPLNFLFTVEEETSGRGAQELREDFVADADCLVNLDFEDESVICVGDAGAAQVTTSIKYTPEAMQVGFCAFNIAVSRLTGGHSGLDINLPRGNAIKILTKILKDVPPDFDLRIATIEGGELHNAIPTSSSAVVVVPQEKKVGFESFMEAQKSIVMQKWQSDEPNISIDCDTEALPTQIINKDVSDDLLVALDECPHGVIKMSEVCLGSVETSTNLAKIRIDGDQIVIFNFVRSSIDSKKAPVVSDIKDALKGEHVVEEDLAWQPKPDSNLLKLAQAVYKKEFDKNLKAELIHGGLECGAIGKKGKSTLDTISIGPTIRFPHSPIEKVDIESVEKFWIFLLALLGRISEFKKDEQLGYAVQEAPAAVVDSQDAGAAITAPGCK
jgi:dipeptidase D